MSQKSQFAWQQLWSLFNLKSACLGVSFFVILWLVPQTSANQDAIKAFSLPGPDESVVEYRPGTQPTFTVACFLGTECPMVKLYAKRLSEFAAAYQPQGIEFLGINSNRQDSLDDIKRFANEIELHFPIGKDFNNVVADNFSAERTPEVFLLDGQGKILYRGRIDDQFSPGITRNKPRQHFLKDAIESALQGRDITLKATAAEGCIIGRTTKSEVTTELTFSRDISRILQAHCVECHRPNQIGPMTLTQYEEVVGWGEMLVEVIDDGRMPPWHASPSVGEFANSRNMPAEDKQTVRDWVNGGMPFGKANEMPAPRKFTDGWRLPKEPDVVIPMRSTPFVVPADGTVEYQYFVVDPKFETDRWVRAAEVAPGNNNVVHHSIVFVRPPDGTAFRGVGWLGASVPGQSPPDARKGFAIKIPAGSKLVFQQHYTPSGKVSNDITKVGLVFVNPEEVTHEVFTLVGLDQEFEIAPNESAHSVDLKLPWFPKEGILLSSSPHMHLRGKSFDLSMKLNNKTLPLLHVPRYDFNWQHNYRFAEPIALKDIDSIDFRITFDNSEDNPFNPDASQHVSWGDQTWQEMAVAFFQVAEPLAAPVVNSISPSELANQQAKYFLDRQQKISEIKKKYAKEMNAFFTKFDSNKDGKISREETPNAIKHFGFWHFDMQDADGFISQDEWAENMLNRLPKLNRINN